MISKDSSRSKIQSNTQWNDKSLCAMWLSLSIVSDSCDRMDCSVPGSSVHGTLQERILEWVVMPSSRGSSWPSDRTQDSCIAGSLLTNWTTREAVSMCYAAAAAAAKSLKSCPTLRNPIDRSPPGSPVPGILQARALEWVAISFSNEWKWKVKMKSLSHVWLFATPWTVAYQAPPSMGFSRQEYWSGVPLPSLNILNGHKSKNGFKEHKVERKK